MWRKLLLFTALAGVKGSMIVHDFTNVTSQLNHLAVDRNTGKVYISGVNCIYKLTSDLDIAQLLITGPVNESICFYCPEDTSRLTDNVNKALLIDYYNNRLITCGSVRGGRCSSRNLRNIEESVTSDEMVVANDATSTTVAFIAPGPPNPPVTQVMYVGITHTKNSLNSDVPAVSSRSLEDNRFLDIAYRAVTTGTQMFINSLARERYQIHYIYGFSSEGFSYFLTVQPRNLGSESYHSKLVRICHDDESYYSYTEVPIICKKDEVDYKLVQAGFVGKVDWELASELGITDKDDVLFASFNRSETINTDMGTDASAICIYPLKAIRRLFSKNIKTCFSGSGNRGLDFISPSHNCIPVRLELDNDFCGLSINTPLEGRFPIEKIPIASYKERLTAVTATIVGNSTVVFAGTAKGHLLRIVVKSDSAFLYRDSAIDLGSPVNKDLYFDNELEHLYVMTERKLTKVKVDECSAYNSCETCKDPYCGWCLLENKCSRRSECEDATKSSMHWISFQNHRCHNITVMPNQLNIKRIQTLSLVNLPEIDETLLCAFNISKNVFFNTVKGRSGENVSSAICNSPRIDSLVPIPKNQHYYTIKMSLNTDRTSEVFSTNLTLFDCHTYSSCTQCINSQFPCDWNINTHSCISDYDEISQNNILVIGVNSMRKIDEIHNNIYGADPISCPAVNMPFDGFNEIVIPENSNEIPIKVSVNVNISDICKFKCQFQMNNHIISVNASYDNGTIYCTKVELTYTSPDPFKTALFDILCNDAPLENPNNVHIIVYNCVYMADDCGTCLTLPEKFKCGWCQNSELCETKSNCHKWWNPRTWLDRTHICSNPTINSFEPLTGPWDGKTNITIKGTNLGCVASDIGNVTVAGIMCHPIKELYVPSKQIVCTTHGSDESAHLEGPVTVEILPNRDNNTALSKNNYHFVNPIIDQIHPFRGPKSGGSRITINGKFLNAGNNLTVFIGRKNIAPCIILTISMSRVTCKTTSVKSTYSGRLLMYFDNARRIHRQFKFYYVHDAAVHSVKKNRGIPSGGLNIQVFGENFHAIKDPRFYVEYREKTYFGLCIHVDYQTQLMCKSPVINDDTSGLDINQPLQLKYGLIMDDIKEVRHLSERTNEYFTLYPNPSLNKINKFVDLESHILHLIVNGENLINTIYNSEDIEILVGNYKCEVVSVRIYQVGCYMALDEFAIKNEATVNARIGNLIFDLGKLVFRKLSAASCMCWTDNNERMFGSLSLLDNSKFDSKDDVLARWNSKINVDNFIIESNEP